MKIELELDEATAMALAQFCKRVHFDELKRCSDGGKELWSMMTGVCVLQTALAVQGFAPR